MTDCPHSTSTTLLWLYGEADEAHAAHVASCLACAVVAQEHEGVLGALGPTVAALRVPPPPRRRPWWGIAAATALIAAVVVALTLRPADPAPAEDPTAPIGLLAPDELDLRIDAVQGELAELSLDLGPL